jgi:hypothetical protein
MHALAGLVQARVFLTDEYESLVASTVAGKVCAVLSWYISTATNNNQADN